MTSAQVLHFSLLRFVYDPKLGDRKKTNNFITFPRTLDMSPQLDAGETRMAPSMRDNAIYDLQGVLLHKGKSAHHGHYVAQVFDQACDFPALSSLDCIARLSTDTLNGTPLTMNPFKS